MHPVTTYLSDHFAMRFAETYGAFAKQVEMARAFVKFEGIVVDMRDALYDPGPVGRNLQELLGAVVEIAWRCNEAGAEVVAFGSHRRKLPQRFLLTLKVAVYRIVAQS